jgi:hypothetical protein
LEIFLFRAIPLKFYKTYQLVILLSIFAE